MFHSVGANRVQLLYTWGGGGGTHLLLALVIRPLTTHPFRDGAPFLLLIGTPPTFGRSLRFFYTLHVKILLILSLSCFAVCGHHLSHRITIVFSVLYRLPNSSMSNTSNFIIPSSNASRSSLFISHSLTMPVQTLQRCFKRAHIYSHVLLLRNSDISLSSFW